MTDPVAGAAARAAEGDMTGALSMLQALRPHSGDPRTVAEGLALLQLLHAVGRHDLPLGRLFEGNVDARQIVCRYGADAHADLPPHATLGVWNADLPGEPLRLDGERLHGAKSFASGAGVLTHALVSADAEGGRQLLLIDLFQVPPSIDRNWWRTIGMQRSETHIVRWENAAVPASARIGLVDDYGREPWFSGGALRFAAVQAGGVAGLCDRVRDHLGTTGRAADPHQAGRLAALYLAAEAAAGAVRRAAESWLKAGEGPAAHVAAARAAVVKAGDEAIALAEQAVGVQGMFLCHPLSAMLADLSVYLRQPAPDAQRMRVGAAVAAGLIAPEL